MKRTKPVKFSILLITALTLLGAAARPAAAAEGGTWRPPSAPMQLTWAEEFNRDALDTAVWTDELGAGGWGNQELQTYTAEPGNVRTENGYLVIQSSYTGGGVNANSYTSARVITKDKFSFLYGRIAARIKLPRGQGPWPAFWLLGADNTTAGWPSCGEIDIMEAGASPDSNVASGAIHFKGKDNNHAFFSKLTRPVSGTLYDSYHIYEIDWNKDRVAWFLDGKEFMEQDITGPEMQAFHQPFFILLNLAVGGPYTWYTGRKSPDASVFPQSMSVDWIRIYQAKQEKDSPL